MFQTLSSLRSSRTEPSGSSESKLYITLTKAANRLALDQETEDLFVQASIQPVSTSGTQHHGCENYRRRESGCVSSLRAAVVFQCFCISCGSPTNPIWTAGRDCLVSTIGNKSVKSLKNLSKSAMKAMAKLAAGGRVGACPGGFNKIDGTEMQSGS